ncbi:hypothetical protein Hanom_Chr10g00958631 [Helianthus anomalus]
MVQHHKMESDHKYYFILLYIILNFFTSSNLLHLGILSHASASNIFLHIIKLKSRHWKRSIKARSGLKVDLSSGRIIKSDLTQCDPHQKLLRLNTREFLDLKLLYVCGYLRSIRCKLPDLFKLVFLLFLLYKPHKTGVFDIPAFHNVF